MPRSCSAAVSVALSPVVPQGTRTSIPPAICRRTRRRKAVSSRSPEGVNGVTSATPAPAKDFFIDDSSLGASRGAFLDVTQGPHLFTSRSPHRALPLAVPFHERPCPRPFAVAALHEQLDLPAPAAEVVRPLRLEILGLTRGEFPVAESQPCARVA